MMELQNLPPDREKPRANLYNVIKRLRESTVSAKFCNLSIYLFKTAYNHTVLVAKLNEMQMKGKHEEVITNFFNGLHRDHAGEFQQKVTGYCIIYAPYYICMLETEDGEFSDFLMREIHKTIGNFIHEQVWVLFATQEVSKTSFFLQLASSIGP